MKLDLNHKIKNLDGSEGQHMIGQATAAQLTVKTSNLEAGRAMSIATRLYANNYCIEIDENDINTLLEESQNKQSPFYQALTNVAIDMLQKSIAEAKSEAKKKPASETKSEEKTEEK